jgi:sodium/potassium-transporting ATPase subunit alpha
MHVENIAILDVVYNSESFCTTLSDAEPASASNLAQVIAVGTICNAASFDNSPDEKTGKAVSGNATGDFSPILAFCIGSLLRWVDAAILRFSDSIASVEITRQRWTNIYRANFNSKVIIYNRF